MKFVEKRIPVYVFVLPRRDILYSYKWNKFYKSVSVIDEGVKLADLLSKEANIKVVNLTNLAELYKDQINIYRKDDSHFTDEGQLFMLQAILKELDKNFEDKNIDIYINKEGRRTPNYYAAELGIESYSNATDLKILNRNYSIIYSIESNNTAFLRKYEALQPDLEKHLYMIDGCFVSGSFGVFNNLYRTTTFLSTDLKDGDYDVFKEAYIEFFNEVKKDDNHKSAAILIPNNLLSDKLSRDFIRVINNL